MKPRDAAVLILVDFDRRRPRVLMGQRSSQAVFMPDYFVFPGGRVEPGDYRAKLVSGLRPEVLARLTGHQPAHKGKAKSRALAAAALREAEEEAGLQFSPGAKCGRAYHLQALTYIARAITPPGQKRIFDTRFFVMSACHVRALGHGDGELRGLCWLGFQEAHEKPLHTITRLVLSDVENRLKYDGGLVHQQPVPCYFKRGARFTRTFA